MKHFIRLLAILLSVGACKQDVPFPEPRESTLLLTPAGGTWVSGKYSLTIPAGAVDTPTSVTIDDLSLCTYVYPASDLYLFRCVSTLGPQNIVFNQPVTLTVTEDNYWLRPVNELGLAQDYPVEKLRLYEINTQNGKATELPGAQVEIKGRQIQISAQISHTGNFQVGINRDDIQFAGGKMEAILSGDITKTIRIESTQTGSGGAMLRTEYLTNNTSTAIGLYADPKNPTNNNAMQITTAVTSVGSYDVKVKSGEIGLLVFVENGIKYTVMPAAGDSATISFIRYEKPGGLVEGSYQTQANITPGNQEVSMTILFRVRRFF